MFVVSTFAPRAVRPRRSLRSWRDSRVGQRVITIVGVGSAIFAEDGVEVAVWGEDHPL